ncbi:synaptonemal complex protein 2-like [Centrocercus urophasianus]|uniref:synaptonemal complex protein 2-like n=1 Tax=Centrocercus urophasianus TaxID=9002 RepID=UPI001C64879F|nr:synaptonemal complex protein 2-like [Centrocercus urophasianus]
MAARREMQQFEKLIDEVTRKKNFELLEQYLEREDCENISYKCSKQFVSKLDKLLCQELDKQEIKSVSTLLTSLWKCGEKISIAGDNGLPAMIKCGLIGKISITIKHVGKDISEEYVSNASALNNLVFSLVFDCLLS